MPLETMVKQATGLPDKYVEMAVTYISFLQQQFAAETEKKVKKRSVGLYADRFHSIADDFDATPDLFEDYI
ncbi:MAG: DUF2281 domain-containing protein [Oscillospiraceae bacterium]|nr:DUF2281 domain-containing protein [Oscillospiraceae bacterium]